MQVKYAILKGQSKLQDAFFEDVKFLIAKLIKFLKGDNNIQLSHALYNIKSENFRKELEKLFTKNKIDF